MPEALVAAVAGIVAGVAVTLVVQRMQRVRAARAPYAVPVGPSAPSPYEDGRTQRVLAAFPFAAFLIDSTGVVRYVNEAAEELFEIQAKRAVGQSLIAVVPSVAMERQVLAAIAGETSMHDITIGDFARERTLGITAHPFEGGAVAVAADKTALLAIEHVRREFVANVSHELRTPLSAIKLMLETVLISDDDAEARTLFLPQVAREVDRMIRLVEDLLELARSESGNVSLHRDIFDLSDVAASVVNTFAQRSTAAGIELDLEAPEEVFVDADIHRLTQVALNLLDNALRHTPAGGTVTVEVGSEGSKALLRVRDTGRGIPYHDLPHIFERFYVVDRSRAREHAGTGLGLSIARHLVEAHGGTLTAHSIYGRGATFICRLPRIPEASRADENANIKNA
jgi:two-component system, OmpR family, phosphate regulon sensor histidine kinase PhoR